jgi:hypothetical protein
LATVSGDSGQGGLRLWWTAVGIGILAIVIYAALSPDAVDLRDIWYPAVELAAVAAILIGVRRHLPSLS